MNFCNMLINPGMEIDQANEGGAISVTSQYGITGHAVDGTYCYFRSTASTPATVTAQRVTDAPPGYVNSIKATIGTAASSVEDGDWFMLVQKVEFVDMTRLCFGTSAAKEVSVDFWIKSSVAGVFAFALNNSSGTRNYTVPFSIQAADTWTHIEIPGIPGDTAGTWGPDVNRVGMFFQITMSSGSTYTTSVAEAWHPGDFIMRTGDTTTAFMMASGANVSVTGIGLVQSDVVEAHEQRPFAEELRLCRRRYEKSYDPGVLPGAVTNGGIRYAESVTSTVVACFPFNEPKIKAPTVTCYSPSTGVAGKLRDITSAADIDINGNIYGPSLNGVSVYSTHGTAAHGYTAHFVADAR